MIGLGTTAMRSHGGEESLGMALNTGWAWWDLRSRSRMGVRGWKVTKTGSKGILATDLTEFLQTGQGDRTSPRDGGGGGTWSDIGCNQIPGMGCSP